MGAAEGLSAQQPAAENALAVARSGHMDSALALLATARIADPDDADLRLAEARILSWAGRRRDAIARYDSLIRKNPENADALIGLGYVYHWQGREEAADRQVAAALALDSTNTDALELRHAIRRTARGVVEASANWSNDSDRNTSFWQTLSLSAPLARGLRLLAGVGLLEASDPDRNATRFGGEAGLALWRGAFRASVLAGARRLDPEIGAARTEGTYRGGVSVRPSENIGIAVGYARYPYDEIASLFERNLTIESLEGGFDARFTRRFLVTGGGGALWLSDGNRRTEGHAAVTQDIGRYFQVGASGRALGYRQPGVGYFSPDRFHLLEGTAAVRVAGSRWDARLGGGLGGQQIGRGGDTQTEWHIDARVGRNWGDGNRIEGFGGVTNSAVSSTTGAFRYRTAGVVLRVGI
ncbi:MAG TPA: tetratricopeptide repeat protein [Gemmatimonadales bacterium]